MKVFCLGGAGRICREAVLDLVQHSAFELITIGDFNLEAAEAVAASLDDKRVRAVRVNVLDHAATVEQLKGYDIVMDGTTITLNGLSTACIAEAGCHGINLNGFGEEDASHEIFARHGKICLPGFGMTPGVTQMMAMHAANQLKEVHEVRVSHGSYRPIAFSKSIAETTVYEYDPELPGRVVFENGQFIQVEPFARPREIELPEPYGTSVQYIIPHAETRTLAKALEGKGVRLVEVRGTWPQPNMRLVRALYEYGFMRNDKITIGDQKIGIMDAIGQYLFESKEGHHTELYGYSLHIEVTGISAQTGEAVRHTLIHTHPASDGSVEDWEGLRAYTRNVGIPLAIATELIASGQTLCKDRPGIVTPEDAFEPAVIFEQLKKRGILIHEKIESLAEVR
ncbi:saccharopine dehydrogenase NADP-binding domain-containing protein [Paenibacillus alkaliterrae]|uniref:saccharopine dehydrogenase family protein n=1 Tax=Paenibacillus alkaliterrae TaxID=320909 RepID=UPI001F3E873A|nr:saccharopine dehydrogenase C-terminal domain-containing protein [Paenibacillus alkaliterrae]MCF2938974.1 saccharopine dehydrogenase NADP-binding domain-containing protein [Paenibacillus alkaliterrae]